MYNVPQLDRCEAPFSKFTQNACTMLTVSKYYNIINMPPGYKTLRKP
jgi:hypothetical protein